MKASYFHYALSHKLSGIVPRRAAYSVGRSIARCVYAVSGGEREAVEKNLRVILGAGAGLEEIRSKTRDLYVHFSRTCVDLLYLAKAGDGAARLALPLDADRVNRAALERAMKPGKGVVLVTAHLGNWELGSMILARSHPVSVIANRHADPRIDRLFMARRAAHGVRVIPAGFALRASLAALKRNELVGIAGDREFSKTGGAFVPFFGRPARLPRGPAILSLRSGAPAVCCFMVPGEGGRYQIRFEEPVFPDGLTETDILRRVAGRLEGAVRAHPTEWFVFEPFWKDPGGGGSP